VLVAEMLERARGRFAARADADGRSITVRAPARLRWSVDPERTDSVLGNLVENALRHGAGDIVLAADGNGETLRIEVTDHGPGFPPQFARDAFERFSRAESGRTSGGAGLGLAIVKAIIEAHGGTVAAGSASPGPGATVTITVPRVG
jgi:signal transduction histidine kinase